MIRKQGPTIFESRIPHSPRIKGQISSNGPSSSLDIVKTVRHSATKTVMTVTESTQSILPINNICLGPGAGDYNEGNDDDSLIVDADGSTPRNDPPSEDGTLRTYVTFTGAGIWSLIFILFMPRVLVELLLYPIFKMLFAYAYPAYSSFKSLKMRNDRSVDPLKWLIYWINLAVLMYAEKLTDGVLSWFPFYYEFKITIIIWLLAPQTNGSVAMYRKYIDPMFSREQKSIELRWHQVQSYWSGAGHMIIEKLIHCVKYFAAQYLWRVNNYMNVNRVEVNPLALSIIQVIQPPSEADSSPNSEGYEIPSPFDLPTDETDQQQQQQSGESQPRQQIKRQQRIEQRVIGGECSVPGDNRSENSSQILDSSIEILENIGDLIELDQSSLPMSDPCSEEGEAEACEMPPIPERRKIKNKTPTSLPDVLNPPVYLRGRPRTKTVRGSRVSAASISKKRR